MRSVVAKYGGGILGYAITRGFMNRAEKTNIKEKN